MKKNLAYFLLVALLIAFVSSGCFKSIPQPSETTIYSSFDDIVNPPDTFQVVFAMIANTDYIAKIRFESNAVWQLDHLTSRELSIVWAERDAVEDGNRYEILNTNTRTIKVGFEGGVQYNIIARRSAFHGENINFFVQFVKKPDEDYDTHTFNI